MERTHYATRQARTEPAVTLRAVPDPSESSPTSVSAVLALQHRHGNQVVLRLLGRDRGTLPARQIQRLMDRAAFAEKMKREPGGYGTRALNNLLDFIVEFHRERAKTKDPDAKTLVPILTKILTECEKFLTGYPKTSSKPGDVANKDAVTSLKTEATGDKATLEGKPLVAATPTAPVIPPMPAEKGTKLEDRFTWMSAKAQQANATDEEKAALPLVTKAQAEMKKVLRKQDLNMKADAANDKMEYTAAAQYRNQADRVLLGEGENMLSTLLKKLFTVFGFVPLPFTGGGDKTGAQQQAEFAAKAKELLAGLKIIATDGRELGGFSDVALIIGGSSTLGHSPHKGTSFGDQSDVDLGVASVSLFNACKAAGVDTRGLGDRTGPDPLSAIRSVSAALEALVPYTKTSGVKADRKVSIMVYKTRGAAQRQVGVEV